MEIKIEKKKRRKKESGRNDRIIIFPLNNH